MRTLPGTDQAELLRQMQEIAGDDVTVESVMTMPPVDCPADAPIVTLMQDALRRADPEAAALPMMITLGTDGKAMARLGIPTYGFTPLRLEPDFPYLCTPTTSVSPSARCASGCPSSMRWYAGSRQLSSRVRRILIVATLGVAATACVGSGQSSPTSRMPSSLATPPSHPATATPEGSGMPVGDLSTVAVEQLRRALLGEPPTPPAGRKRSIA